MTYKRKCTDKTSDPSQPKRARRPPEDDSHFMAVALLFAKKSPDPNTKVGACIVNKEGKIVGVGYNEMPNGCEGKFPWNREGEDKLQTKYPYVCHAELKAVMNKTSVDVKGCTVYTTLFPCNECAKVIIQSGIIGVVYLSNKYEETVETQASVRLLNGAGIAHRPFETRDNLSEFLTSIDPFTV